MALTPNEMELTKLIIDKVTDERKTTEAKNYARQWESRLWFFAVIVSFLAVAIWTRSTSPTTTTNNNPPVKEYESLIKQIGESIKDNITAARKDKTQ